MLGRSKRLLESTRSLLPLAVDALPVQHGGAGSSLRGMHQGAPWLVAHFRCIAQACSKEKEESVLQPRGEASLPSVAAAAAPAAPHRAEGAAASQQQQAEDRSGGQASSSRNGSAAGARVGLGWALAACCIGFAS